ncbi:pentapeptide repeat-containing protein [Pseudomonas sp. 5P_3.1_Bac2]|uniref:pentapeptide repeat-containing protein n=1 Tax=Pseudomonas sp. 5P_3.1_Bac2 TaxID=2971617 RepID=UPI0021CA5C58|nr:pentapeptide repeat-containing protein [Pseudomonas sp. 5P_3.1_Bac2]MCU1718761.1 pentapeptide repeat-containing protein [Pseudomonas sp. 5P_3.1_Bac2]
MNPPRHLDDPLYTLLHNEDIAAFNSQRPASTVDLSDGDFRGLDLRTLDATDINFRNAYFRGTDLRGLDLRTCELEGASLAHAQISGSYFPAQLSADEILMSVNFGTRLRYNTR